MMNDTDEALVIMMMMISIMELLVSCRTSLACSVKCKVELRLRNVVCDWLLGCLHLHYMCCVSVS